MAEKALFHKTIITTGYGPKTYYFPAQRQDDVINALQTSSDKVVVEKSKWLPVQIEIGSSYVYFSVGNDLFFEKGDFGFDYLVNQFKPLYQRALIELHGNENITS
ncbi:hypothetical protein [Shewanella atlantica]|uniref:hypothetical protein n=1 Tax=Shewanella atlantica TaxID=271099 RepID=UPI00373692BD